MPRILFIFCLILVSISSSLSKDKISKSDFDKLVDYANSKYVMTFVNEKEKNNKDYLETYKKNIEPILKETSLNNLDENINFEDLKSMFDNNTTAQGLVVEINNKRKNEYDENKTNEELISIIVVSEWANIDLKEISENVQKQLKEKYLNANSSNKREDKVEVSNISNPNPENKLNEINDDIRTLQIQIVFLYIACVLLTITVIVLIIMLLKKNRNNKDKNIWDKLDRNYNLLNNRYQSLKKDVDELSIKVSRAEKSLVDEQQNKQKINKEHEAKTNPTPKSSSFQGKASSTEEIFFKTKNGRALQEKLPSAQESAFKVYDLNNNEAKFDYCGGVVNPDFFGGVCNFENNPSKIESIKSIETTTPGRVKKDNNGDWVVETPAIIKFL